MRKTLGITLTTAALLFGGAGVANATAASAPAPSSTMTLAEDNGTATDQDRQDRSVGPGGPSWSARTRRTQAAQRHQRRPLRGGPRGAWQPEYPPALEQSYQEETQMTEHNKADQARRGLFDSVKGKAKEIAGAVTGNDSLTRRGATRADPGPAAQRSQQCRGGRRCRGYAGPCRRD